MNIEELCDYYLDKPGVTEGYPFGRDKLVLKMMNKTYALTPYTMLNRDPATT